MIVEIEPLGADVEIASTEADLTALSQDLVPTGPVGPAGEGADVSGINPITVNSSDEIGLDETALVPGSSGEILFNDSGVLGSDSKLTWDGTELIVSDPNSTDSLKIYSTGGQGYIENNSTDNIIRIKPSSKRSWVFESRTLRPTVQSDLGAPFSNQQIKDIHMVGALQDKGNNILSFGETESWSGLNVQAKSGQIDPLLSLQDENANPLFTDQVSGDRKYHTAGSGIVLTSPDGNTTKRVYLDNSGNLQTETP